MRKSALLPLLFLFGACSSSDDTTDGADGDTTGGDSDTGGDPAGGDTTIGGGDGSDYQWVVTRVDQGTKPDIALDSDGTPLIAYMLERVGAAGFVRVAQLAGEEFVSTTIQTGYMYGPLDVEVSSAGVAAVAYHNHDWEDGAVAIRDGADWNVTRIDDAGHDGWDPSLAFDAAGDLHLMGIDPSNFGATQSIEYAKLVGNAWQVESIGAGPQPYEWGTDIEIDTDGNAHAVYFDAAGADLVYANNVGGSWTLETIYETGDAGRFAALSLDPDDVPRVAFFQTAGSANENGISPGDVVYGTYDASDWSFEVVGGLTQHVLGFEGARRTLAMATLEGMPVVAYIDESALRLAIREESQWNVQTVVEAAGDPLQVVGFAAGDDGTPHLTYSTITANGPLDGEVWYAQGFAAQ